jgi:hypothetical protein
MEDSLVAEGRDDVLVQVVELGSGRQIGWGSSAAETLGHRARDLQRAIAAGIDVVRNALPGIHGVPGWSAQEVSATFAITLTAESGVVLARASTEASFEITVMFRADHP